MKTTYLMVYASMTGNTEEVANLIGVGIIQAGAKVVQKDILETDAADLQEYDGILLGSYTWGDGDLPDEFLDFYEEMDTLDLSGKKGEIIFHAGTPADTLYIVSRGKIRIYRLSESGKEQVVRILNPGDFTGELALFKKNFYESYGEAMEETNVCTIRQSDLQELLLKYPSISLKILTEFSNRLEQSEKQTTRFATEKVETRLALFLAECLSDDKAKEIILPMSRKDLASYLGTSPETISRKLAELENQGYIKQKEHKRIEILDLDGLLLV